MRIVHTLPAFLLVLATPAMAKCVPGVLIVRGDIAVPLDGPITVTVDVETPKGTYEETAHITQPGFTIHAGFSRWSGYSLLFLGGDRCRNHPSRVVITAERNGKALGVRNLDFKRNTIPSGLGEYTLGSKVVIDAAGIRLQAEVPGDGGGPPPAGAGEVKSGVN
jgi:hypothetical protein